MKTIENIEKEYENYFPKKDIVKSLDQLLIYIEIKLDDIDINIKEEIKERRENTIMKLAGKIRNYMNFIFAEEEVDFYDEDNDIISECILLENKYKEYLKRIMNIANEDNFVELVKLIDFSFEYYKEHIGYLNGLRESLNYSYMGFNYVDARYQDNRIIFDKFFSQIIKKYTPKKAIEKKKKI